MKKIVFALLFIFTIINFKAYALEKGNYEAAVLIEVNTGKILFEYNKDKALPQASITKIMTYFVFRDFMESQNLNWDEKISVNLGSVKFDRSWAAAGLRQGDRVSLKDLIMTMMVNSANDSAMQLQAYYDTKKPMGYNFIEAMNIKSEELGFKTTRYVNSTGLTETEVYNLTSAYETALLSAELLGKYPDILEITRLKEVEFKGQRLKNWNLLLFSDTKVDGLKTGHTDKAGYCLVSTKDLQNGAGNGKPFRLLAVVLGTPSNSDRFEESKKLLSYGETNFENRVLVENTTVFKLDNEYYKGGYIEASVNKDIFMLVNKNEEVDRKVEFYQNLPRKISKGDEVGEVVVTNSSTKETITEKIYAVSDYESVSFLRKIILFFKKLFG